MKEITKKAATNISSELIKIKQGKTITTSLEVAWVFGKRHDNVLRDIKNLGCSEEFSLLNFEESSYINEQNKEQPMVEMTRDGFVILAMGYTGAKAMAFKEKYIAAFNYMEGLLLHDVRQADALYGKIDSRMKKLEEKLSQLHMNFGIYSTVSAFAHACCTGGHAGLCVKKEEIYTAYREFCSAIGKKPENKSHFCSKIYTGVLGAWASTLTEGEKRVPAIRGIDLLPGYEIIIDDLAERHIREMEEKLAQRRHLYFGIKNERTA